MNFSKETARSAKGAPERMTERLFGDLLSGIGVSDAVFTNVPRGDVVGVAGLPWKAPVATALLHDRQMSEFLTATPGSFLLKIEGEPASAGRQDECRMKLYVCAGAAAQAFEKELPPSLQKAVRQVLRRILQGPGVLNDNGEQVLDLTAQKVGSHYPVNLLLGDRSHDVYPLFTTPKSAVDSLGRGSFRSVGGEQVLATRCVLDLSQNGEPANRQFYLFEKGEQIFYSADIHTNVRMAQCVHSQNHTVITYETKDGLSLSRTIFLLPQEEGLPNAVEVQLVTIANTGAIPRDLKIVMTGVFGIADATTIANDDVYANLVQESEIYCLDHAVLAVSLNPKPAEEACRRRFAMLLYKAGRSAGSAGSGSAWETMDDFETSAEAFIGSGTWMHPENCGVLSCRLSRKNAPFFAMGKAIHLEAGETVQVNELVGMVDHERGIAAEPETAIRNLYCFCTGKGEGTAAGDEEDPLQRELCHVKTSFDQYSSYLRPTTKDVRLNAYVGHNLPFQVLYQTYVSRAFAWTQKSYRETGFREIQDIYASMYYLCAIGENELVRNLLSSWICQVYEMGYANHDFTFEGKEPGDCSDDQLWLIQAVYRYVQLTGDTAFLLDKFPVAGFTGADARKATGKAADVRGQGGQPGKGNCDEAPAGYAERSAKEMSAGYAERSTKETPAGYAERSIKETPAGYAEPGIREKPAGYTERSIRERPADASGKRSLWDTFMAILTYSGRISTGRHGLPLLDKADWNDTLRLDPVVLKGPAKEKAYRTQLEENNQPYGTPWENQLCESCMNACLLKIAADEVAQLGRMLLSEGEEQTADGKESRTDQAILSASFRTNLQADVAQAGAIASAMTTSMQKYAWKDNYFARCLINDGRGGSRNSYTYLGAKGDGLSLDPDVDGSYFLNSYSWAILSGIATQTQIRLMLDVVNRYLKTDAGLKLCTLIDYDRLGVQTGTALYFPGDRENCGVFKHAAMMATVASLRAARTVEDPQLARALSELAYFMIDRTLPYKAMDDPYVRKGNPRFCTQYNNSQTGENVGPMLSGTSTWLTLAMFEIFGIDVHKDTIHLDPVLRPGMQELSCDLHIGEALWHIRITSGSRPGSGSRLSSGSGAFSASRPSSGSVSSFRRGPSSGSREKDTGSIRAGAKTQYTCDGKPCGNVIPKERTGEHDIVITL